MVVYIDTASKIEESPKIIGQGINLAFEQQNNERNLSWTRFYKKTDGTKLEINLVGEKENLENILNNVDSNNLSEITSQPSEYQTKYKEGYSEILKRFKRQLKAFRNGDISLEKMDSCLVADYLAQEEGVAIHFNDTSQARISQLTLTSKKDEGIGLLTSMFKLNKENKLLAEPLLIADAGMQIETTYELMLLNALYSIATAKTMGIEPRIILGSASNVNENNQKNYTKQSHIEVYNSLKKIETDMGIKLLGFDKTYRSPTSMATIHLDFGRHGNEFPNNINLGTKIMKSLLTETIKSKIKTGNIREKILMSVMGLMMKTNTFDKCVKDYKQEQELNLRGTHGHLMGTNSFKVNSDFDSTTIASAILGAYDFNQVKDIYFEHVEEMKPYFQNLTGISERVKKIFN